MWMVLIGLLAIYAVGMFVVNQLPPDVAISALLAKTLTPSAVVLAVFGILTCVAAAKQLRQRAPMWVAASLGLGITFFIVHLMSIYLILVPKMGIEDIAADFAIDAAWDQLTIGPLVVTALFALPLAYNLFSRRTPS